MGDTRSHDVDRGFYQGRNGGGPRGNEQSDRPGGRFAYGQLSYGGNGCPAGTMQAVFAPDNLSFTILFDKFVADTTTAKNGRVDVMSCDAVLPITIPPGQQMEITRVDYRGFANIPAGGRGLLQSSFNFVGTRQFQQFDDPRDRINFRFNFSGPVADNYELSSGSMNKGRGMSQTEVSPCGGQASLVIRNTVQVVSSGGQQAQLTVDSIDGQSNAVYYVNWRACKFDGRGGGRESGFVHGGGSSR